MEYYDADPPSFSLGLDLDLHSEPQSASGLDSSSHRDCNASEVAHLEYDDCFDSPDRGSTPPRAFKRLRRGLANQSDVDVRKAGFRDGFGDLDDEIEDFSDGEDLDTGVNLSHSVCNSSKPSLFSGHRPVIARCRGKLDSENKKESSSASGSVNREHPKSNISPVRKFQLIDSDSDDLSIIEDRSTKTPNYKHSNEGLWKDFFQERNSHVRTPVFDEVFDEYFRNADHCNTTSNANFEWRGPCNEISWPSGAPPPVHSYFFNKDPRIRKLLCDRLPYFFPLGAGLNQDHDHLNTQGIDYMAQFSQQNKNSCQARSVEEASTSRKKNAKRPRDKNLSQNSENWVDPKSNAVPKNSGNRRVTAESGSTGYWFTNQSGQKVYVNKNGQQLTGRLAYKRHRMESGRVFRKSRKTRTSNKKRSAKTKKA